MSRHISPEHFYKLPSGTSVHPCRLIHKDGTLMWKHALLSQNELVSMPESHAHEAHIIKTAQRLEELNSWVSQNMDPWEFLKPIAWYVPHDPELCEGISCYVKHTKLGSDYVYETLQKHLHDYEVMQVVGNALFFRRC